MKNRANHRLYLEILRGMSPEERLRKAFDLSDFSRALFVHGLRHRFPDLSSSQFAELVRQRLEKCRKQTTDDR